MASPAQLANLKQAYEAALTAATGKPIFLVPPPWLLKITPEQYAQCAACEAMAETGWGAHVPNGSLNWLGIKAYKGWTGPVVGAAGTEQNPDGTWTGPQSDLWCVFPSLEACFAEQLMILQEPRYAAACEATTPMQYIVAECAVWSTGQQKGATAVQIFNSHAQSLLETP
jgi:hypothetical protein